MLNIQPAVFPNWYCSMIIWTIVVLFLSELFLLRHQVLIQILHRNGRYRKVLLKFFLFNMLSRLSQVIAMIVNNIIPEKWASSSNCKTYSRSVDKGYSEELRNISEITSDIKLTNALDTKTSLQLLFENIQSLKFVFQFSSKMFRRTGIIFATKKVDVTGNFFACKMVPTCRKMWQTIAPLRGILEV